MTVLFDGLKLLPISLGAVGGKLQVGDESQSVVMLQIHTQSGNAEVIIPPEHVGMVCDALQNAKKEAEYALSSDLVIPTGGMQEAKAVAEVQDSLK